MSYQLAAATEEGRKAAGGKGQAFSVLLLYPSFLMTEKELILPTVLFLSLSLAFEGSEILACNPTGSVRHRGGYK